MIVLKFGGSSIDSPAAVAAVADRVRERLSQRPVVVVSAMARTTRRLLEAATVAASGEIETALSIHAEILAFHRAMGEGVVPDSAHTRLREILERSFLPLRLLLERVAAAGNLTPRDEDEAAAYGELLASEILAFALPALGVPAEWVDCRRVVVTDATFTRALPDESRTAECLSAALRPLLERGRVPVVGGYVGSTADGVTTTLGKEGSDFSAALVGASLGAEEIQIWTDVDGILTADPRIVPAARRIRTLSFAEALELARSGAKKPHPGTLGPAGRRGVPIRILNTRNPTGEGTLIGRRAAAAPTLKSIACRRHAVFLRARSQPGQVSHVLFADRILAALTVLGAALMVVAVEPSGVELALDRVERLAEIQAALSPLAVLEIAPGRSVLSLVSEDLATSDDLVGQALQAMSEHRPRLVTQGVAAPVVRAVVDDQDLIAAVTRVHERVFSHAEEVIP